MLLFGKSALSVVLIQFCFFVYEKPQVNRHFRKVKTFFRISAHCSTTIVLPTLLFATTVATSVRRFP